MAGQNFAMHSGDSKTLSVSIVNGSGVAVDVSTATAMSYKIADTPYSATAHVTKTLVSGITVATSTVTITLGATDTATLDGIYYHELQITDASSNIFTAFSGTVIVQKDLIT